MDKTVRCGLDSAAYYRSWGCKIIAYEGRMLDTVFVVRVPFWFEVLNRILPWVNYKSYVGWRKSLKNDCRARAGLPIHYSNRKDGFKFSDLVHYSKIARVTP